jgi:hypothetical protein
LEQKKAGRQDAAASGLEEDHNHNGIADVDCDDND